jgi:hypothetical protein
MLEKINKDYGIIKKIKRQSGIYKDSLRNFYGYLTAYAIFTVLALYANVVADKSDIVLLSVFVISLLFTIVFYHSGVSKKYNKNEIKRLKDRNLFELINEKHFYRKKTLNKLIDDFDLLSKNSKKYVVKNFKKLVSDSDDFFLGLIINDYRENIKSGNEFDLLKKYINEIKNDKKIDNSYKKTKALIMTYIEQSEQDIFFKKKYNLILLIENNIKREDEEEFVDLIDKHSIKESNLLILKTEKENICKEKKTIIKNI